MTHGIIISKRKFIIYKKYNKCRSCDDSDETVDIISECSKLI